MTTGTTFDHQHQLVMAAAPPFLERESAQAALMSANMHQNGRSIPPGLPGAANPFLNYFQMWEKLCGSAGLMSPPISDSSQNSEKSSVSGSSGSGLNNHQHQQQQQQQHHQQQQQHLPFSPQSFSRDMLLQQHQNSQGKTTTIRFNLEACSANDTRMAETSPC